MSDTTDIEATCRAATEAAAVLVGVQRASVWRLEDDQLVCEDLFLRDEARHTSGQLITRASCPTYFTSIRQSMALRACDARTDARTRELHETYLAPLGIGAMLDTPIWQGGAVRAILCCEHVGGPRRWTDAEERDSGRLADLVARSMEASTRRAAEERWRIIVESIPQYVLVVDEEGNVIQASATATRLLEREGGATLAERFDKLELRNLAGELLERKNWPAERARRGETVRGEILEFRSRVTADARWLRATSAPVRVGHGLHGAVAIYEDVAEEIRIERVKREFLRALAHELRTPTTIIKGYAQRLMKTRDLNADEKTALAAITRASGRIEHLGEAVIDLTAITLGRIILAMEHVDLADIVLKAVAAAPASRTHAVHFQPSREPARVFADSLRIQRVIGELISNAARYSNAGSPIDITLDVDGGYVRVSVRDRGVGIGAIDRSHVFEPFFRGTARAPNDSGGIGIGLFLAREIVERHGGTLSFASEQGSGSTFTVSLPLDEQTP